ncbi:hypothetical protein QBC46DRAFT_433293 [Diplogelasinospora grovesii]|uniref:EKC/KEOPS complex subunit BUD32 n=1 Tax=Diplogelasinospora grovesii TaxID=303347 RepID=A0AAN6MV59_9PEZI|nr:hypothetical protein QBC46DRAFT_433293 [Diplogelasinospora grovesii]
MEIIDHKEAFKLVDKHLRFHCVKGIVQVDGVLYLVEWENRTKLPVDLSQLRIVQRLETEDRGLIMRSTWTRASEQDCHIKTPGIHAYYSASDLKGLIFREIETYELLKTHPHPNISRYFGCMEVRGRVYGLCFKRYKMTLLERVNPECLNKTAFLLSGRPVIDVTLKPALDKLSEGIKYIHSLGIIHNDITPSNIMVDYDGTLGELLDANGIGTKRTYGWHNLDITVATEKNDLDAFTELQTWLFGFSADSYLFNRSG